MTLIAWCPSGKRAPRARTPQPQPQTPTTPAPATPTPTPNPNPTPTTPKPSTPTPVTPPPAQINPNPATPVKTTTATTTKSNAPIATRPSPGTGIAPYFWDQLFDDPNITASILPMWENWWIRNRLHYLSFKEPIVWFETSATGETVPVATGVRKQVFNVLVQCMKEEKSPVVRATGALALGKFKDKTASEALKDSFKNDKDFDVKNVDALSLGILGEDSIVNDLKIILNDNQSSKYGEITRAYAALALGYINNKDTVNILKNVVSNTASKEISCAALLALGNSQDKSLVTFIAGILNDTGRREEVRAYAAIALGRIKDTSALPALKKAVQDQKGAVRASVAIALGLIKSPDSKDDLLALMKDKTANVRGYAIISLAQLGDKSLTPAFLQTIKKQDYFAAGTCALALGILGDEKALPELREIVKKKKNLSAYYPAIVALGLLKDKDSVPLLINIAEKDEATDTIAWYYAIQALGMIGDQKATPVLEELFKKSQKTYDFSLNGYNNLVVSLAMLGKRKEVLSTLYDQLKDSNKLQQDSKWRVLHGIGYIGDKTSIEPLINYYRTEDEEYSRMYAVFALGMVLDKDKINPLYKITADNNFNIWLRIIDHIQISKPD